MGEMFKDQEKTMFNGKVATGIYAGALGSCMICPVELSMVRMAADGRLPPAERRNYRNVFHAMYRVLAEEGVRGGWAGAGPTMARACVVTVTQLGTNEEVKERLSRDHGLKGYP